MSIGLLKTKQNKIKALKLKSTEYRKWQNKDENYKNERETLATLNTLSKFYNFRQYEIPASEAWKM